MLVIRCSLVAVLLVCLSTSRAAAQEVCGSEKADHANPICHLRADADALFAEGEHWGSRAAPSRARTRFAAAGEAYLAIWKAHGVEACREKRPECQGFVEVLYEASRAFHAAQLGAERIATLKVLVNPQLDEQPTALRQRAMKELGDAYLAITLFDVAADWYERLARLAPKNELAPECLENALELRLGLGDVDRAVALAQLFRRNYGIRRAPRSTAVTFAILDGLLRHGDYAKALKNMSARALTRGRAGHDLDIRGPALVARVLRLNRDTAALEAYRRVIRAWQARRPEEHVALLNQLGGSEEVRARRIGRVLTDVGEALFYEAEEARALASAMKPPRMVGPRSASAIQQFQGGPLNGWISQRKQAIADAEKRYLDILLLPHPPPLWTVSAYERVASMWEEFRADLVVVDGSDQVSPPSVRERVEAEVRRGYDLCVTMSVKFQEFGESAQRCQARLTANSASPRPPLTELAPSVGARSTSMRYAPLDEP